MSRFLSHLQHSRPCCIGYTNSRLRLEFVYPIQHGSPVVNSTYCLFSELPLFYILLKYSVVPVILVLFLFVIFINHLPYIVENITETTLHADDAKLHKTITPTTDFEYLL